ncbi:MFS transporter [Microbacterium sp. NPDC019599]|uniref:MFS transporter n=1 Tax=Microbacterium sp. NPDC019599 TaxID=3154690 RepID=UPI0033EBA20A
MVSVNEAPPGEETVKQDRALAKAGKRTDRVSIWRMIPWSTHAFSMNALIVLIGYFTIYATDTLRLNPALVGGLLVAAKIIDAIGALFAGYVIDRAPETKLGKARPFDLVIILCWAATACMFSVPGGLGDVAKYAWIFTSYVLLTALFMPLYNANNPLYTARVFPKRAHYSDVAAKTGIVTVLAAIVITVGMPIAIGAAGKDPAAWSFVAICVAIPFTLIGLVRFWTFRESSDAAEIHAERVRLRDILLVLRTNPYIWVLSSMSVVVGIYATFTAGAYYFRYIVGDLALQGVVSVSFVALIPLMFFFPALIRRFSVSRMIAVSSFIGAAGFLVMMVAGDNIPLIMVSSVLTALASLPVNFLSPILVIDNATYNEWKGHRRLESVGGALFSFSSTVGAAIAAGLTGVVLATTGYDGGADTQSPGAIGGIVAVNSWIPAIFAVVVGFIALYYHRLEHRIKAISAEVLARREIAAEAEIIPGAPHSGTEAVRIVREESGAPLLPRDPHHGDDEL